MGWGLLFNRYTISAIAMLALVWGVHAYLGRVEQRGYDRAMSEVAKRDADAAIKGLMREMRRDDIAGEIVLDTLQTTARDLARVTIETSLTLERIRPLLPDADPDACRIPDGVWSALDQAAKRAEAAGGERL